MAIYILSVRLSFLWATNAILNLKFVLSHNVGMVTYNVTLGCLVTLSCLALFIVPPVMSLRTSGVPAAHRNFGMGKPKSDTLNIRMVVGKS